MRGELWLTRGLEARRGFASFGPSRARSGGSPTFSSSGAEAGGFCGKPRRWVSNRWASRASASTAARTATSFAERSPANSSFSCCAENSAAARAACSCRISSRAASRALSVAASGARFWDNPATQFRKAAAPSPANNGQSTAATSRIATNPAARTQRFGLDRGEADRSTTVSLRRGLP